MSTFSYVSRLSEPHLITIRLIDDSAELIRGAQSCVKFIRLVRSGDLLRRSFSRGSFTSARVLRPYIRSVTRERNSARTHGTLDFIILSSRGCARVISLSSVICPKEIFSRLLNIIIVTTTCNFSMLHPIHARAPYRDGEEVSRAD